MSDVKLESNWGDNVLLCPCCGGENLHHEAVTIYDRFEDAPDVRVTTVEGNEFVSSTVPNDTSANPSSRRHGVGVDFWCESCHGESNSKPAKFTEHFVLQLQQHKGSTYLDWYVPKK